MTKPRLTQEQMRAYLKSPERQARIDAFFKRRGIQQIEIGHLLADDDDSSLTVEPKP